MAQCSLIYINTTVYGLMLGIGSANSSKANKKTYEISGRGALIVGVASEIPLFSAICFTLAY